MRLLTWNLWWRNGPWQARQEAVTATLAELAPDVCGLQEVWGDVSATGPGDNLAAYLAERLGMHWCWTARPARASWQRAHGPNVLFGNAILSRWPIIEQAQTPLPVSDGLARVGLHAALAAPAGRLPFFTTHFSHDPASSATRVAQARALAGFVAAHTRPDNPYPPVVSGDLNAEPDSDELRLLGGTLTAPAMPGLLLVDAWRYAERSDPGFTWDHRNPYLADDPFPDARVDYLLVGVARAGRGRVHSVRLAGDRPVRGVWPSDHLAVLADLAD